MRDPRAVRSSRNKIGWCNFKACNSAEVLCQHYEMDLEDALTLSRSHPENVIIVKYEELVTRPLDAIPIILKVDSIEIFVSMLYLLYIYYVVSGFDVAPCSDQVHLRPHDGGGGRQQAGQQEIHSHSE